MRRGRRTAIASLVAALAAVVAVDITFSDLSLPMWAAAALDESGHLATAWLLMSALPLSCTAARWPYFAAATFIDLDHLPLSLFSSSAWTAGLGRPYTHSLITPLVLLCFVLVARPGSRGRRTALLVAAGVGAHFFRDVATGPGLALAWPLSPVMVQLPNVGYFLVLLAAVGFAVRRTISSGDGRSRRRRPSSAVI